MMFSVKKIVRYSVLLVLAVSLNSCEKIFTNPKLDNFWKLDRIVYPSGYDFMGNACTEVRTDSIFYGFARDLVEVENHRIKFGSIGVMTDYGDSLKLDFSMYAQVQDFDVPKLLLALQSCGLGSLSSTYRIVRMDKRSLVLEDSKSRLEFVRW